MIKKLSSILLAAVLVAPTAQAATDSLIVTATVASSVAVTSSPVGFALTPDFATNSGLQGSTSITVAGSNLTAGYTIAVSESGGGATTTFDFGGLAATVTVGGTAVSADGTTTKFTQAGTGATSTAHTIQVDLAPSQTSLATGAYTSGSLTITIAAN